ncbi:MAG: hypothetical protein ABIK91_04820 [Pseudomonadota bacterium]
MAFKTPNGSRHATGDQAEKDFQPVGIGKGLENSGEFPDIALIVRHVSKLTTNRQLVKKFFQWFSLPWGSS